MTEGAKKALLLSPHPDDEVITGLWPYRLKKECDWQIVNVAVTLGSDKNMRATRLAELEECCEQIGFRLVLPTPQGLEDVRIGASEDVKKRNSRTIADIISRERPDAVFMPHFNDLHSTHCGTHTLGVEALKLLENVRPAIVYTEYWHPMSYPNVMMEASFYDLSAIIMALSCHRSQVERNPYDERLPDWMSDNVRRGAEVVGGAGSKAPQMRHAVLYGLEKYDEERGVWRRSNPKIKRYMVSLSDLPDTPFV